MIAGKGEKCLQNNLSKMGDGSYLYAHICGPVNSCIQVRHLVEDIGSAQLFFAFVLKNLVTLIVIIIEAKRIRERVQIQNIF